MLRITLSNIGGELDHADIEDREDEANNTAIQDVIAKWSLSEGDTITIRLVD